MDRAGQRAWIRAGSGGAERRRRACRSASILSTPTWWRWGRCSCRWPASTIAHTRSCHSAMARKPHHAGWYHFPMCHYFIARGDYESALREIKAVNMPMMPLSHLSAAAISGHLGRTTEARAAFAGLRAINPGLAEPAGAKAFWSMWLWDDAFIETLFDGFNRATELADERSGARSDVRSGIRSDDRSIAVLPFADLSEKKDQDWFCDGIAEEILNALAQLPGLRVAARASAFSFRGKADDLEAIGEKLNVSTVLEGSVRRAGDRVRITAQLSDARQGQQLWSERFDRELKDIFDVQEEIARAIADRLRISISRRSAAGRAGHDQSGSVRAAAQGPRVRDAPWTRHPRCDSLLRTRARARSESGRGTRAARRLLSVAGSVRHRARQRSDAEGAGVDRSRDGDRSESAGSDGDDRDHRGGVRVEHR